MADFLDEIKQCNELFCTPNFYTILGLAGKKPEQFTPGEIRQGFRKSSLKYHPDRVQNASRAPKLSTDELQLATKKFQLLAKIYMILNDLTRRGAYDKTDAAYDATPESDGRGKGTTFDRFFSIPITVITKYNDVDRDLKITSFEAMSLPTQLLKNVRSMYQIPMPIQQRAIPHIFNSRDVLGWSPTGSGKTAAFTIPILTFMINEGILKRSLLINPTSPVALVLVPTRELALQVTEEFKKLLKGINADIVVVVGGRGQRKQLNQLRQGCDILVATPGRLISYIKDDEVSLSEVKYFVLDEADLMLDKGFGPAIRKIVELGAVPPKPSRLSLMFSATFPRAVQELAKDFLEEDHVFIKVDEGKPDGSPCKNQASADKPFVVNKDIKQTIMRVSHCEKLDTLVNILNDELKGAFKAGKWTKKILVFDEGKADAEKLVVRLENAGILAMTMNSSRRQRNREDSLKQFANGNCPVLVATSVAARGLDVNLVDLVINYQLPRGYSKRHVPCLTIQQRIAFYVQRIGRTGRVGNLGRAIAFFDPESVDMDIGHLLLQVLAAAEQEVPPWFKRLFGQKSSNFLEE